MFTEAAKQEFKGLGFTIALGLFSKEEAQSFIEYYMSARDRGGEGWAEGGVDFDHEDPLRRYPRLMQPHRDDAKSLGFLVDPRINEWLSGLLGAEPFGVQTMVYFKPPGARGQSMHQDQRYLQVQPGTCVAAWMALDDCDAENGCMNVVPGTQNLPVLCSIEADLSTSFSTEAVPIPDGAGMVSVPMKSGDVLFFNGSLIHGSPPNRSNRFRRILVGHYIVGEAKTVSKYYFPVYRMDGTIVDHIEPTPDGGSCGRYTERNGEKVLEMSGKIGEIFAAH